MTLLHRLVLVGLYLDEIFAELGLHFQQHVEDQWDLLPRGDNLDQLVVHEEVDVGREGVALFVQQFVQVGVTGVDADWAHTLDLLYAVLVED